MPNVNINQFLILLVILFSLHYLSTVFKKDNFDGSITKKTKQCSRDEINNAYKEYIFSSPPYIHRA
jgi:hypothetical protein